MDIVEHLRDLKLHNAADEIERLRDLLGKANALARIRAENLAACQKERDNLQAQLITAVKEWKRFEQMAGDNWLRLMSADEQLAACQRDMQELNVRLGLEIGRKNDELAACQADAERWKYWRKQWAKQQFGGEQLADPKELDAAIDAARGE